MPFELRVATDLSRRLHACQAALTVLCHTSDALRQGAPASAPARSLAASPQRPVLDVLIIDDDRDTRVLLDDVCTEAAYRVDHAPDGATGLAMALASTPRLVLLDVYMPGLDGLTVAQTLTSLRMPMPPAICLMTAAIGGLTPALPFPIITKPFDLDVLVAQLNILLGPPVN